MSPSRSSTRDQSPSSSTISTSKPTAAAGACCDAGISLLGPLVGIDDLGDEITANDVAGLEPYDRDVVDLVEYTDGFDEARFRAGGQIDLRGIARHHHFRAFADTR